MRLERKGERDDDTKDADQFQDNRKGDDSPSIAYKGSNDADAAAAKRWASSGIMSSITSQWLTPLFRTAKKRGLHEDDLCGIAPEDSALKNATIFSRLWEEEIKQSGDDAVKASLGCVILRFVRWRILGSMILVIFNQMTVFLLSTVSIRGLLLYSKDATAPLYLGLLYAVSAMLFTILYNLTLGCCYFIGARTGARLRGGVVALLLRKILRLRGLHKASMGEIVNLCVNDGNRLYDAMVFSPLIFAAPVVFICACVFTTHIIGKSALIGMLVYMLVYAAQFALTAGKVVFRTKMMKETDKRVHTISEMLTNIKFIKMYAWEDCFEKKINDIRKAELRALVGIGILRGIQKSFNVLVPTVAVVSTIMLKLFLNESFSSDQVLTYVAVIYSMRSMLTMTQFGFQFLSDLLVSVRRIKNLMIQAEVLPIGGCVTDRSNAIELKSVTATWDDGTKNEREQREIYRKSDGYETSDHVDHESDPLSNSPVTHALNDISIALKKGSLVGVCGSVGSGKTSLIHTLLQQTHIVQGSVAVEGSLAYTSQEPDIFHTTVRENITMFGDPREGRRETEDGTGEKRYLDAIRVSCLSDDIAAFPCGDRTEIGERGVNLSGGQKHRMSLARAVYADRDIYLLDDPLSAVDTRVAEHIFTECIVGSLKNKTVLLVTANLQYLSKCDEVIVISNGRVIEQGTPTQLMANQAEYARLIQQFGSEDHARTADDCIDGDGDNEKTEPKGLSENFPAKHMSEECHQDKTKDGRLVSTETREQGEVNAQTYLTYCRYAGGVIPCFLSFVLYVLSPASAAFNNYWLSYWLTKGSGDPQNATNSQQDDEPDILQNPRFWFYRDVYLYSFCCVMVICSLRIVHYVMITQRASFNLHRSLFQKVFSCPMEFFDTTPSGRVLNRFSRDIDEADNEVPNALETALWTFLSVLSAIIIVIIVFPWFIIGVIIAAIVFVYLSRMFLPAIRDIKRIENIKRSPLISHIKAAVEAQTTILAFGMEKAFIERCNNLLDTSAVPKILFVLGQRWLAFRLDLSVSLAQLVLGLSVVFTHNTTAAAFAGLALAYSVQLLGTLQYSVRLITITQARFTSIERIIDYVKRLISERCTSKGLTTQQGWPKHGKVTFDSIEMKYRDNLPAVLKGVSFHIHSKEKIGIIGRTGSGKSSIGVALFRLVDKMSGRILIDDLDISSIPVRELRSCISVIPQDPVLFRGTLRFNLDPYDQFSDHQIWDALENTFMKKSISAIQQQLQIPVSENGSNFSAGERQLLCLARALLRNSVILFLDEATAAVDVETDNLVQSTIRTAFSNCTVLTIAHRLHTVLDSDRILVMEDGFVLEMDTPSELLANPYSRLNAFLRSGQNKNGDMDVSF